MAALSTFLVLRSHPSPGYDFLVWLIVGLAPFLLFKNIALKLMGSVDANKALFSYKQIQPADAFVARTIVEFCISALVFILLYGGLTWYGYETEIRDPMRWMLVLFLGVTFSFSLGVLFAIIAEAVPESAFILRLVFLPLYFLSGVIFSPYRIPPEYLQYVLWNPYLHIIDLIRDSTFDHYHLRREISLQYVIECTIVSLFIAFSVYRIRRFRLMAL